MLNYDVAVVGGGLSGLSSAILLAKKGKKVVLFEKNSYPFHRVCGEYISLESLNFLKSLGIDFEALALPIITKLRITTSKNELQLPLPLGGFGISRYLLDELLAQIAEKEEVTVLQKTSVQQIDFPDNYHIIQSSAGTVMAKVCIGAFGKRSNIDKQLKRPFITVPQSPQRNYVGVKYHVQADLPSDLIELHLFKDGYCGISQIETGRYCMCYLTTANNLQQSGGNIQVMEQKILAKNPFLKDYFQRFNSLYEQPLTISQVNFMPKSNVDNHILMTGDAAGLITPLCGNGMSIALHTAYLLSSLVNDFLENKKDRTTIENEYQQSWKHHFHRRLQVGRAIQHWFFHEKLINIGLSIFAKKPNWALPLIQLTHGKDFMK